MGRKKKVEIPIDPVEIGKRAYEKWLQRGCVDGYAQQDWFEAEAELKAERYACVVAFEVREKKRAEKREEELRLSKVEEKIDEPRVDSSLQEPNSPMGMD
jgi:hypothetical protein